MDRQIPGVLATAIKADLQLSDRQLGLLGGFAFALLYVSAGIPLARIADRVGRVKVIAVAIAVWSLFSAACGLASNFWQLFLMRMGVGVGEAGGVAPSYALIGDYFPPESRGRALAIFSFGLPIGSAVGIFFGAWIAATVDWRMAFIVTGLLGVPVALLLWMRVPEPDGDQSVSPEPRPTLGEVAAAIGRNPSFWLMGLGTAASSLGTFAMLFWAPGLLTRSFHLPMQDVSWFYGSIVLFGGIIGIWLGGWLSDRWGPSRPAAYALIPCFCMLAAAPVYAIGLYSSSRLLLWICLMSGQALALVWQAPVLTTLQQLVPRSMRAVISSALLFLNNVIGQGFGVYLVGELSTRMASLGDDSLRQSMLSILPTYLIAAMFYALASTRIRKDSYALPAGTAAATPF